MPEISRFLGIGIRMFYNGHGVAHFHVAQLGTGSAGKLTQSNCSNRIAPVEASYQFWSPCWPTAAHGVGARVEPVQSAAVRKQDVGKATGSEQQRRPEYHKRILQNHLPHARFADVANFAPPG